MNRKVLVLDIDGTLTNSRKEITPATRGAIEEIQRRGHVVVLATGRPTGGVRMAAQELELAKYGGYILSYNGACVASAATGEAIFKNALPDYVAQWMQAYACEYELGMCSYEGEELLLGTRTDRFLEVEAAINRFSVRPVESFGSLVRTDLYKVLLTAQPVRAREHELRLARRFIGRLSVYRSEPYFIEVMARGVSKGDALAGLLERLGIRREDSIACGDGFNDLSMIRYAGVGVAMGNAQQAVKDEADLVTLSNDEDGLVPVIERCILGAQA